MGTEAGEPTLGTAERFSLRGDPDFPSANWDVVGPDGTALGSMVRDEGGWPRHETTYSLRDAQKQVLAVVETSRTSSRDRYAVSGPGGDPIGTLDPAGSSLAPLGFTLNCADGVSLRLDGQPTDGVRALRTHGGEVVGEIGPDPAEPDETARQALLVRLSGELTGPARELAVVAICSRDLIEQERRRTQSGRLYGT